jgi:hypothetical protein
MSSTLISIFRLLNRNKKSAETAETVDITVVKRRGILGHLGLKKKAKDQAKEEDKTEEPVVEEHAEEAAPSPAPVEETKPLEPEAEDAREVDEPKEEEPAQEESAPAEEIKEEDEIVAKVEEREQPIDATSTPKEATSTGFLCGCL